MGRIFGTDGVRGTANIYPMTAEVALQLGRAAAFFLKSNGSKSRLIIGKDTRLSCYMLEQALAAGICSMGADVYLVGPVPTPAISFLTSDMRCDAGIMISASHNPYYDNGIKFFSSNGLKIADEDEREIEKLLFSEGLNKERPTKRAIGKTFRIDDAKGRYISFVKNTFPKDLDLSGLKIAIDCANGAAYRVAPLIFEELGAEVYKVSDEPDGTNINRDCGSTFDENISKAVLASKSDMGFAFDGDGDRVILCDKDGNTYDGDYILAISAEYMKNIGTLKHNTVVTTIMCNYGLELFLSHIGVKLLRANVGDRYVLGEMLKGKFNLGGEQSGHIIFLDDHVTGDGLIAALKILNIIIRKGEELPELAKILNKIPQILLNVPVKNKRSIDEFPEVIKMIDTFTAELGGRGRILVRPSGTEPKIRIMVEGEDEDKIKEYADEIKELITRVMA